MSKTYIERVCPKCGERYLFWLFGRTPCGCTSGKPRIYGSKYDGEGDNYPIAFYRAALKLKREEEK